MILIVTRNLFHETSLEYVRILLKKFKLCYHQVLVVYPVAQYYQGLCLPLFFEFYCVRDSGAIFCPSGKVVLTMCNFSNLSFMTKL